MCVCVCAYILKLIDGHLGSFCVLAIVNSAAIYMGYMLGVDVSFKITIFIFPDINQGVWLLNHMAVLFLVFKEPQQCFV